MGTAIAIAVALGVVSIIGWRLIKSGRDAERAKTGDANAKVAEKIADATATAPRTLSELRDELQQPGGRKL